MEWEREQQKKNKNKQRAPFRSNPQTHHSVWHDDTSLWPEYSYRTSPASHRCIIHTHTETHKHTSAGSTLLPGIYIATANLTKSSHSYSFTIPPPWHEHIAKIFYGAYSCKRTTTKLLWASFTAKVGVRVYPLASHNIDKAVLSGSKPQPSSRNTGRQTGLYVNMRRLQADKGCCFNSYRQALMDNTSRERETDGKGRNENEYCQVLWELRI